ncbi:MAG: PEP-CTERM sorting domain-containing protein [Planctomycetales bacterium]|nr:PEP-CTERM sorting domain-containing protein [Planctomycetales bacterium]
MRIAPNDQVCPRTRRVAFLPWPYCLIACVIVAASTVVAHGGTLELADGPITNRYATLIYHPSTGNLTVYPEPCPIVTLEMVSSRSLFMPERIRDGIIVPSFDVASAKKIFVLKTSGFGALDFGDVLPPGLGADELLADLGVSGSSSADCLQFAKLYFVPEPSGIAAFGIALPLLIRMSRRRRERMSCDGGSDDVIVQLVSRRFDQPV